MTKLHEKVRNQRIDFLHKLSSTIINENQVVENLHVKGLLQNGRLSKAIFDSGWTMFLTFLSYKAKWYGRDIIFADRFYPSSKLCSECGYKNTSLTLYDREWTCPVCRTKHDRYINAAKNLLYIALSMNGTARTYACEDSSGGGTSLYGLVYEAPVVEAGSPSLK